MKKSFSLVLAIVLVFALTVSSFAAGRITGMNITHTWNANNVTLNVISSFNQDVFAYTTECTVKQVGSNSTVASGRTSIVLTNGATSYTNSFVCNLQAGISYEVTATTTAYEFINGQVLAIVDTHSMTVKI